MWSNILVFGVLCASAGLGLARRSPHADLVQEYFVNDADRRYSDNLIEDAQLDVPGLITKYGYPYEVHNVTTDDGYVLEMHRIPHGRDRFTQPDPRRPVVFVMHGLFSSSADWVLMGPGLALGYVLAEAGYDVWLGNARGNYYSRNHVSLNPDSDSAFWRFSWEEIGRLDLPAMIDHILETTGKSRLHYIGHSQGTTAFWVMGSMRPEYNNKIIGMQAFAPVAYLEFNANPIFRILGPIANNVEAVANMVGVNELLPNSQLFTMFGSVFCRDGAIFQPICTNLIFMIAGTSHDMHNATMWPVKLGHTPAGIATRQLVHYGQFIGRNHFQRFDHGRLTNWREYRSFKPPRYELNKVTAPVFMHFCDVDVFADLKDVEKLWRQLGRVVGRFRVPHATFSHLDFMWGTRAKELLYDRTINLMNSLGSD